MQSLLASQAARLYSVGWPYRVLLYPLLCALLAIALPNSASAQQILVSPTGGDVTFAVTSKNDHAESWGQSFTVPVGSRSLQSISFWFGKLSPTRPGVTPGLRYRLHVIGWDPLLHQPTGGLLFSSSVFDESTLELYTPTKVTAYMHVPVSFDMKLLAFASPLDALQPTAPNPTWTYAMFGYGDSPSQYSGGEAWSAAVGPAFGSPQTLESAISQPWGRGVDFDMLFEANFSPTVVAEPTSLSISAVGVVMLIICGRLRRRVRTQ
jgi:hypothetical protein